MGYYDLPAMINKVLETTGQEKLFYTGHSMGTTAFMVMANVHPEMNDKVELAHFLAPVAYMEHAESPLRYLAPIIDQLEVIKYLNAQLKYFYAIVMCFEKTRSISHQFCSGYLRCSA